MNSSKPKKKGQAELLWSFLEGSLPLFFICISAGLLHTLTDMLLPQIIRFTVDSVLDDKVSRLSVLIESLLGPIGSRDYLRSHMWIPALFALSVAALSALGRYISFIYNSRAGETLVKTMRDRLYRHILRLPWSWHQQNATGDIIQRCTSDVDQVRNFFQEQFVAVFRIVTLLILSLFFMFSINVPLTLVALVFMPIIFWFSLHFHVKIRKQFMVCDENEGVLSTIAQENLTGVRVVRAFGRETFEKERFDKQNTYYTGLWVGVMRSMAEFWAIGDLLSGLQIMSVIVLGSIFAVKGTLSSGDFIAFISYNLMLVWPIRMLGRMISAMSKTGVSVDRLAYILESETELDRPEACEPAMDGDITFDHVSFRYTEETPEVLSDISFTIPAHSSFGILGGTGSGKSSLVHLLCRLYEPTSGSIRVGGTDIADMKARHVRNHIGIVLQEPFLFSRSIEENIGICGASAEEVRAAAVTASIHEDIEGFSQKYDTLVGERGVTLSGGQKQRVAMARALTKDTPVIIFDDSLSAVDTETDAKIRTALAGQAGGMTRIIISHRITTLMDCDYILVLDKGQVSELGTPAELFENGGIYRRIYDIQMSLGEEEEA